VAPHGSHERPSHHRASSSRRGGLAVPEQSISHKPDQEIGVFLKRSGVGFGWRAFLFLPVTERTLPPARFCD